MVQWDGHLTFARDAVIRHLFTRGLNNEQGTQQCLVVLLTGAEEILKLKCFDRPTQIPGNNALRKSPSSFSPSNQVTLLVQYSHHPLYVLAGLLLCRYIRVTQ